MTNDTRNFVTVTGETPIDLPPPRFDEDASANAQPVQPLPISGPARWMQRVRDTPRKLGVRWKAIALVALAGSVIGAASGAMLAKRHPSALLPTAVSEEAIVETATAEESIKETSSTPEGIDIRGGAVGTQSEIQPTRIRRHRLHFGDDENHGPIGLRYLDDRQVGAAKNLALPFAWFSSITSSASK